MVCSPAGRRARQRAGRAYNVLRDACGRAIDPIRRSVFVAGSCGRRLNFGSDCKDFKTQKGGKVWNPGEKVCCRAAPHFSLHHKFNPAFLLPLLPRFPHSPSVFKRLEPRVSQRDLRVFASLLRCLLRLLIAWEPMRLCVSARRMSPLCLGNGCCAVRNSCPSQAQLASCLVSPRREKAAGGGGQCWGRTAVR